MIQFLSKFIIAFIGILFLSGNANAQDDLYAIVEATSSPVFLTVDSAYDGFEDDAVMLRQEFACQQLSRMSSTSIPLDEFRRDLLSYYSACNRTLRTIRRLDSNVPDFEGVVAKTLKASPAIYKATTATEDAPAIYNDYDKNSASELAEKVVVELFKAGYNAYQASEERAAYRTNYRKARAAAVDIEPIVRSLVKSPEFTHYGMGCVVNFSDDGEEVTVANVLDNSPAKKAGLQMGDRLVSANGTTLSRETFSSAMGVSRERPSRPFDIKLLRNGKTIEFSVDRSMPIKMPLLEVDVDGSFDGWYSGDLVFVTNKSGANLSNVILFVDIKGRHGASVAEAGDQHMHFIRNWPAGEFRLLRYMSTAKSGIASNESVDQISSLQFRLYSDQFSQTESYQYSGQEFDHDVEKYLKDVKFSGGWHSYPKDHLFFNSGFKVTTTDGRLFRATSATVTAWSGDKSKSFKFNLSDDVFDGEEYFSHRDFNGMNVSRVDVTFHLPYTDYKLEPSWSW